MMALHPVFIIRNFRISEVAVIDLLEKWGFRQIDVNESSINAAINFIALGKIGIHYDKLTVQQQENINERCNTTRVFVRKILQDENGFNDVSFYQVYLELFPNDEYLSQAVKLN